MANKKKINLSRLNREQKQRVWRRIQETNPPLANLLTDIGFQSLKDQFGAEVVVEVSTPEAADNGQY
ncbi:hypothetical protein NX722_13505 [Endozoicomonas gorgoniicola]|uniref:Uncharacterized protein n=1 Tax=Endozoicomonas gorgoniicola TaxID=1234144 RepID=A0ABT3MW68_9GAMM|nr:hypothetical protein [Endozoicomonas gorgoniicola]MCW7553624.1 hypothetical protein [Endozoicomonas gorgoniicola]